MKFLALCVVFSKLLTAQVSGQLPGNLQFDGKVAEWQQQDAWISLHDSSEAGRVWVRWNPKGLVVAALVTRPVTAASHVELWLDASAEPELPALGWGNQFGEEPGTPEHCAERAGDDWCLTWIKRQTVYRAVFPRLFLRRWRLSPGIAEESYAAPTFRSLTAAQQKSLQELQPKAVPQFAADASKSEYSFEILVPWDAFPAADRLKLDRIGFQVDVRGGGLALTTLSKGTKLGGLPQLTVAPPIVTEVTPCGYRLSARNIYGDERPAYYFINERFEVAGIFVLQNDSRGYQYLPSPDALSPGLRLAKYFSQALDPGEFLCGPQVAYRKGSDVKRFPELELGPGHGLASKTPQTRFPAKRLADGTRLVEFGPDVSYSEFGSGQCGACPVVNFKLFALLPSGEIRMALALSKRVEDAEYELEVSSDWSRVTEFFESDGKWRSVAHCLAGHEYKDCGENPVAPAPQGRTVRNALK